MFVGGRRVGSRVGSFFEGKLSGMGRASRTSVFRFTDYIALSV